MKLEELLKTKPGHTRLITDGEDRSEIERIVSVAIRELNKDDIDALAPSNRKIFPYDYTNLWHQACYIARYSYAYAREYTNLFLNMLNMGLRAYDIKILSLGCGNMIDIWGLQEALLFIKDSNQIQYVGVDNAPWFKEYIPSVACDRTYVHDQAGRYMLQNKNLDFDVFIFPKSIGDIAKRNPDDFDRVKEAFRIKQLKDDFYIAFSIVQYDDQREVVKDLNYAEEIVKCVLDQGYKNEALRRNNSPSAVAPRDLPQLPETWKMEIERLTDKRPITNRSFDRYKIYRFSKDKQNDIKR